MKTIAVAITVPFGVLATFRARFPTPGSGWSIPGLDDCLTTLSRTVLPLYFIAIGAWAAFHDIDYATFTAVLIGPAIVFGSLSKPKLPDWYTFASLIALLLLMILCTALHYSR